MYKEYEIAKSPGIAGIFLWKKHVGIGKRSGFVLLLSILQCYSNKKESKENVADKNTCDGRKGEPMGDNNTEVKDNQKILEEAIKNPGNEFPELKEQHEQMVRALEAVVQETDRLYTKDAHGKYPKLDKEVQKKMIDLYQKAIDAVDTYKTDVKKIGKKNREKKVVTTPIVTLMDNIETLMGKDFKVLLSATRHGIKTLPDVILRSRTNIVDLGNQNTAKAGANMSSRMRIKVTGKDGGEVEGFFTPDQTLSKESRKEELKKAYKKLRQRAKGIVDKGTLDTMIRLVNNEVQKAEDPYSFAMQLEEDTYLGYKTRSGKNIAPDRVFIRYLQNHMDALNENGKRKLFDGTGLSQMLGEYFAEMYRINNKYDIIEIGVGMESMDNINQRNSAMSDIAQLLDMENLIAYSESMVIKRGDKIVKGTFMEQAKGDDVHLPNMGSVFADPEADLDMDQPQVRRQLADLQILDYICGNIDRHNGNVMFQFDRTNPKKPVCTGVQGIDNDSSFGRITDGIGNLPKSDDIGVISAKTALMVNNLSPAVLKTTLRGYKFSEQEINAAIIRTQNIQQKIRNKSIRVVQEDGWKNLNKLELKKGYLIKIEQMKDENQYDLGDTLQEENMTNFKKHFKDSYKLGKTIEKLNSMLETADQGIWNGSQEFKNVRMHWQKMMKNYKAIMDNPTQTENYAKMKSEMEKVMENARAYQEIKKNKELNQKEIHRLKAINQILEEGEIQNGWGSIDMLEKCNMQIRQTQEWVKGKKSFDSITKEYLSVMQKNVEKYPEGSDERINGELALQSVKALAEMAKENIHPDIQTQNKVASHIAAILAYDPKLIDKTELTYAYGSAGENGRKRSLTSAIDIVTFLIDVHTSEKIKAKSMQAQAEKESKIESTFVHQGKTSQKENTKKVQAPTM